MAERTPAAKIALIGVLGVVLAIILVRQYGGMLRASEHPTTQNTVTNLHRPGQSLPAGSGTVSAGPSVSKSRWARPDQVGPIRRDPMLIETPKDITRPEEGQEGPQAPTAAPEFRVAGIVFNADQPSSIIIDGQILHEGETIHGATVTRITKEYGVLRRGEKSWTVIPGQANKEPD